MKIHDNRSGFSIIEVLFVSAVVATIGLVGWRLYQSTASHTSPEGIANENDQRPVAPKSPLKTYTNTVAKYTVQYPETWTVENESSSQGSADYKTSTSTFTSPSGTALVVMFNRNNQSGTCQPAPTDKPFQKGNACPSAEYLWVQKLTQTVNSYSTGQKVPLLLVQKQYADKDLQYVYAMCLGAATNAGQTIETNKPASGYVLPTESIVFYDSAGRPTHTLSACVTSDSKGIFDNADGKNIAEILRSVRFN